MSPPTPSIAARVAALEAAFELMQARRLLLLLALRVWTQDVDTSNGFDAFVTHLEERIAEEEP